MGACTRCDSAIEPDDLRCPVCSAATPHAGHELTARIVMVLRCDGCGAGLSYDAERGAPHCAFCGATMRLEQTTDPLEQAQHALPFLLDETAARTVLDAFLHGGGFFHPGDLATASGVSSMQPLFWASFVFDAEADVSYTTDSDAGHRRSRWAPHAGVTRMRFENVVISASRGLALDETRTMVPAYDLGTLHDASALASLGPRTAGAERFELQRSAVRRVVADAVSETARARVQSEVVPGSRFRKTNVSLVIRALVTRRVLLPAWILTYTYAGEPYRVVVHGQDARIVVGKRPLSLARVAGTIAAVLLVIVIVIVLVLLVAR